MPININIHILHSGLLTFYIVLDERKQFLRGDWCRIFFEVPELSSQNSASIVKRAPSLAEGLDPTLNVMFFFFDEIG